MSQAVKMAFLTALLASIIPSIGMVWTTAQFVERSEAAQLQLGQLQSQVTSLEGTVYAYKLERAEDLRNLEGRFVRVEEAVKFFKKGLQESTGNNALLRATDSLLSVN